ncbi:MAG: 5'-nucleotidase, lipoprotein e(P4) family [Dolichospermum sp. OL03]|nr:5'-nucleotidase, lipoprotein e(P4) family [Dolichospermum sp. OL03]MCS6282342.1 5'-nucleotidase, lipoprotein e(P4) family [Dolichospermum sp.]
MSKLPFTVTALVPVLLVSQLQQDTAEITTKQLNQQGMLAVNWVQQSGEYRALTYQAFNLAKLTFDIAKSKKIARPAIIVDIDETVLDNSPYQAGLLDSNKGYETTTWNQWIKAEKAKAVPGAVEFVNYVNKNGGKVFFISNRNAKSVKTSKINDLEISTIKNLKEVGFTGVNENTVLLKGEFSKIINSKEDNSKQWRVDAVKNGSADKTKYTIVALIGDNLNDFDETAGNNNQQRRNFVDKNRNFYGMLNATNKEVIQRAYIAISNPMYGNWETGMYNSQAFNKQTAFDMTPAERNLQRRESLNRWWSQ